MREVVLSEEGLRRLEEELEHLRSVKRREVADRIKAARDLGDISENSEYDDAKTEQAFVEGRILHLENVLRHAQVLAGSGSKSAVSLGSQVRVKDLESGDEEVYTVVGTLEADPAQHRISNESPVGRALIGKGPGTVVTVEVPAGLLQYEVMEIIA